MKLIMTDFYRIIKNPWLYFCAIIAVFTFKSEDGTMIILPILAALPMALWAYLELKSKIAHTVIFKTGRKWYILSKCNQLLISSSVTQIAAFAFYSSEIAVSRILGAVIFAFLGSISALLTKDIACAFGIPCALSFGLWLVSKKFLKGFPINYYNGEYVFALVIVAILTLLLFCVVLYGQVKKNVL